MLRTLFVLSLLIGLLAPHGGRVRAESIRLSPFPHFASTNDATTNDATTSYLAPQLSLLSKIRARNNVMIAGVPYDFAPYSFVDAQGQLDGFDVELLTAMGNAWGIQVEFVPVLAADALTLLANGAIDVSPIAWPSFDINKILRAPPQVDFSQPYLTDSWCLLQSSADEASRITDSDSAVSSGQSAIGYLSGLGRSDPLEVWLSQLLPQTLEPATFIPYRESRPALEALSTVEEGHLLTFRGHCQYLKAALAEDGATNLYKSDEAFRSALEDQSASIPEVQFVWGVADSNASTRSLFNYTLQQLVTSGKYKRLFNRWFAEQKVPNIELHAGDWEHSFDSLTVEFGQRASNSSEPVQHTASSIEGKQLQLENTKLRVGISFDYPPFGLDIAAAAQHNVNSNTVASNATPSRSAIKSVQSKLGVAGLDFELALAVTKYINDFLIEESKEQDLAYRQASIDVEFVPTTPQAAKALLRQGALDMVVAATSPLWSDAQSIAYSRPYLRDQIGLLVKGDVSVDTSVSDAVNQLPELSLDSLALDALALAQEGVEQEHAERERELVIACVVGEQGAEIWFSRMGHLHHAAGPQQSCRDNLPFLELSTALRALEAGQADAIVGAASLLRYAAENSENLTLVDEINAPLTYSIAVPAQLSELRRMIDGAIFALTLDGTLENLHATWLKPNGMGRSQQTTAWELSIDAAVGSVSDGQTALRIADIVPASTIASLLDVEDSPLAPSVSETSLQIESQSTVAEALPAKARQSPPAAILGPAEFPQQSRRATAVPQAPANPNNVDRESQFDTYTIQADDTLVSIAVQLYGDQSNWLLLYEANRNLIGDDPSLLVEGLVIYVPLLP